MKKFALPFILLISLSACGGSGGGSSASSATNWTSTKCTSSYTNSDDINVPCAYQSFNTTQNGTTGSYNSSTYDSSTYVGSTISVATQNLSWRGGTPISQYGVAGFSLLSGGTILMPSVHLTDTDAAAAWANGWTGTGVSINIIDDAQNTMARGVVGSFTSKHSETGGYGIEWFNNAGDIELLLTHGSVVRDIAGGDKRTVSDYTVYVDANTSTATTPSPGYGPLFTQFLDASYSDPIATSSIVQSPGVAKDATMTISNVDLSSYQNPITTWAYLKGFIQNSSAQNVVNLSVGYSSSSSTYNWEYMKNNRESFDLSSNPSGTYIIAAGNDSAPCTTSNFNNCNLLAAGAALNSYLKDQIIIAGATDIVSGTKTIATYSNQAGVFADRYLMASGDSGYDSDASGTDIQGTSFAAPRIAGAAAIVKSKFPNLTGANVADILLLTADKDINDDGNDDFSSVSSIYGRGELDLSSALSPVGNLTP